MENKRRQPIGIELVKRGIVKEEDIEKALIYQKTHPRKKLGDILNILEVCDSRLLIQTMGEILGEKAIYLEEKDISINILDYISLDVAKKNRAVPFEIGFGKVKVCFAETTNKKAIETIRLLFLNKGLVMEKYITFDSNIETILSSLEGRATDNINTNSDISELVDSIIKTAMDKRASDIHIEPLEKLIRVRYRIDGQLITAVEIDKEKQAQMTGRLKAISNMHQEKQDSQDGRIVIYQDYNIRVSTQRNIFGEKFVLRLLKKSTDVRRLFDLGFPDDELLLKSSFDKKNSVTIIGAPTGEGKTTTLYGVIDYLNRPEVNVTTIEDPVEIRIQGLNQIETDSRITFSDSLRTVLRQDPDIILVGEIRDSETAEIAMQAGQTGHYVLSTIHTIDSIEVITRLRKMGVSNYDISSILATTVSQRLVRRICPYCAEKRDFTTKEKDIMDKIAHKYGEKLNFEGKYTFSAKGCDRCNNGGYYERIGIFEVLVLDENIKDLISNGASSLDIRRQALKNGYRPLVIDGINKVIQGITTLEELNYKLSLY